MKTLVIGGGYLAQRFISLSKKTENNTYFDVITRSQQRKEDLEVLGCNHYCEDISRPQFKLPNPPQEGYDRVLLNAAVTVDRKVVSSKKRLYTNGTQYLFQELERIGFSGKLILIGSTSALPSVGTSNLEEYQTPLTEEVLECLHNSQNSYPNWKLPKESPSYQQYIFWKESYSQLIPPKFTSTFLMSAGIYGEGRHPANRLARGLRVTHKNPEQWINLIHVEDLARAILFFFQKKDSSSMADLYFVSNNTPITLQEYYREFCKWQKLPAVTFQKENRLDNLGKYISSNKLLQTGFCLVHPSILHSFSLEEKDF
jgi:nucleoside-diphosphate-sugar epimerase